jgi:hypothetical protein
MPDFIPRRDKDLAFWSRSFLQAVSDSAQEWGIPDKEVNALQDAHQQYETFLKLADGPLKHSVHVANKKLARKKLELLVRSMVRFRLQNPVITDSDRLRMGLHVHDAVRTPAPLADSHPDFEIDSSELRRLSVHFFAAGKKRGSHAKPNGQHGVEIRWGILDQVPESIDDLTHSAIETHSPFTLSFDESQRGKFVYFVLCWENTQGMKGPWGQIVRSAIP